jgi:tRNA (guanine37-N1)-methyltransferase
MKTTLKSVLKAKLTSEELDSIFKSYNIVGDIAVIRVPKNLSHVVAEAIMQTHKRVRTVLRQVTPISSEFRLRHLECVIGPEKTQTMHKEFGCVFNIDLETCYFSPRLSFERIRLAGLVQPGEIVVNMFAGVGCFSILIAKHTKAGTVYSIDLNPSAFKFMKENVRLNRVEGQLIPILGDAKQVTGEQFLNVADRVIMPLPNKAYKYLECAILALKPVGGWIHYYCFEHASKGEKPIEKTKIKVAEKLQNLDTDFTVTFGRIVRRTGPNWHQVALDIKVNNK